MRHARTGKKLGRDASHRKALYANLACSLIEHGRIRTTEAKAKAVKPYAERMITLARRGGLHARRQALSELRSQEVVHKLFSDVAPRMADRPGGYSRIVKLGPRQGDAADMVYLELVDLDTSGRKRGCGSSHGWALSLRLSARGLSRRVYPAGFPDLRRRRR
jgi:large subunit ribosomal protein L17